jgi:uncharacterized protein (TIGR00369 family)
MKALHQRVARSFELQGLMATLGATLDFVGPGEVHIGMPASGHVSQQHGYAHAGAVSSILDSACGYAALTVAAPGFEVVTAEFKINLMRPAIGERFLAVGKVVSAGRTLTVCSGEVRAFSASVLPYKVVALMQATVVNVAP